MADVAPPDAATVGPPGAHAEAGQRGRLSVADRVVERLATHTAVLVPGVITHRDLLRSAVGRTWPRASAQVSGRIVAVDVDLAVAWGTRLDDVASTVRQRVRAQLQSLAGVEVTRVNVTVGYVVPARTPQRRVQ